MLQRESIIEELQRRMSAVEGVLLVARNPKVPPANSNLPAILIFELDDEVLEVPNGTYPYYSRRLKVSIEMFILATAEASSSKELGAFLLKVKTQLYTGGITLGGLCNVVESLTSRILRPPVGEPITGISLQLDILYFEDVSTLFT